MSTSSRWRFCRCDGYTVYSPSFSSPWRCGWRRRAATGARWASPRRRRRWASWWWTAAVFRRALPVSTDHRALIRFFFLRPSTVSLMNVTSRINLFYLVFKLHSGTGARRQSRRRRRSAHRRVAPAAATRLADSLSYQRFRGSKV